MDTANSEAAFDLIRDHGISAKYVMGSLDW